jgi:hypothetical protein
MDSGVLDDLVQRLAFERMLARLYRALGARLGPARAVEGRPSHRELEGIEAALFRRCELLDDAIDSLAPDHRTTPASPPRLVGTCEFGSVLADPRCGYAQCIEAILVTELLDNHAWSALVKRFEADGRRDLAGAFTEVLREEQAQLSRVRSWLRTERAGKARAGKARAANGRKPARLAAGADSWHRFVR